jgi:oligosaccharyltransferase complex subunit epsilon
MAPKRSATPSSQQTAAAAAATVQTPSKPPKASSASASSSTSRQGGWDQIVANVLGHYQKSTPQRTKLIDVFLAFLVVVGALQFLYCILAGNYVRARASLRAAYTHRDFADFLAFAQPFNAFLSGFSATVGQFVLTGTLYSPRNDRHRVR